MRLSDGTVIETGWVVLCAGTYGSPVILMRSGIGPAEHLRSASVPVRVDLPGVGANLADHPGLDVDCGYAGPGRSAPALHAIATFHRAQSRPGEPPDLMFWFTDPDSDDTSFEISVLLLKPQSRGAVRLRSADPLDPPSIDLPNLSDPFDVERLIEGYRRALEVANHPRLRQLCATGPPGSPSDDGGLGELIRREARSLPHVVGTCSMGPPAAGGVVDARGAVHGVERLSVIDASIMPDVPSGFTHVPTIMIAERLSEFVASHL